MAGRVSTAVNAARAEKIFTNDTSGAVVATVHMASADNTKNPICNIAIDSVSTRSLNFTTAVHTLATALTSAYGIEADLKSDVKGTNILGSNTSSNATRMKLNGTAGNHNAGSYSPQHMYIDPYFFTNPEAYGKDQAAHGIRANNYFYLKTDISTDKSHMQNYLNYTNTSSTGSNIESRNYDYYGAGGIICSYTDCFINFETNAYMSGGHFYDNTSSRTNNNTSDSAYYQMTGSGHNPNSYKYNDPMKMDMASDAGLFIYCMHPSRSQTKSHKIGFISANRFRSPSGNSDWDGTTFNNYTNATGGSSFVSYSAAWQASVDLTNDGGYLVSWMKYNLVTKKFYLNMQGDGNDKGIYSFNHNDLFPGSNLSGSNYHANHATVFTKETATHPLTEITTEPMRIGAALWQVYKTGGISLYSTDLINWKTAVELTGQSEATAIYHDTVTLKNLFTKSTGQNTLFGATTGYTSVNLAGMLENKTGIGNYERNGLILNSGDSIYVENTDALTNVNATVMFVEV